MRPTLSPGVNHAFLAQMQQARRDAQAAAAAAQGGPAQTAAGAAAARQPFRTAAATPVAAGQAQNRGVLFTGAVQAASVAAPLARLSQRLAPAVRPVSSKRCGSCS